MKSAGVGPRSRAERVAPALLVAIAVLLGIDAGVLAARGNDGPSASRLLPVPTAAPGPNAAGTDPPANAGKVPGPPVSPTDPASPLTPITPGDAAPVAAPARVSIPAIGVNAPIENLSLAADGSLIPPSDFTSVGWYAGGPAPGSVGPSVLAGHVDSKAGPAVFWRLRDLVAGDVVAVIGTDGVVRRFAVTSVAQYAKDHFPTDEVYGIQATPVLRLVTCGGVFDRSTGHYRDNVVVYADEVAR